MRALWQCWEGNLTTEECKTIINKYKYQERIPATTFGSVLPSEESRKTEIVWVTDQEIKNKAYNYIAEANRQVFGYDIDYLPPIQFGIYKTGSFYKTHYDVDWKSDSAYDRKLSISIQLSDPKIDYEGGKFLFDDVEEPESFNNKQGTILVFPSFLNHSITPVTKGTRYSLVGWMEGPRWR